MTYQLRYSKSLGGGFSGTPHEVWRTIDYTDRTKPTCFFGMYDARDFLALWRHKGKAWILWCGGDLNNLDRGFILNDGKLRWISKLPFFRPLLIRLLKKAEHWVENEWEKSILTKFGIKCQVCPSFLGDVSKYKITYKYKKNPHFWLSASEFRQKEYGWNLIEEMASYYPTVTFHLYGASWKTKHKNVIVHGRIPIKQMDRETSKMQGSIRYNEHDGFSEVTAKSILWGQYPATEIDYPFTNIRLKKTPNIKGRNYYLKTLNRYPWNAKKLSHIKTS